MDKICVDSLIFEVTKRCNMNCWHCLRGDARNVDMTKEIVDTVLDRVESIGSLTFSGGEPTLNLPIIEYIFSELRRRKIPFGYFWMASNGLSNQFDLAKLLMTYYYDAEEPDMNEVSVSIDIYHDEISPSPLALLGFYGAGKEHRGDMRLVNRGRAKENGLDAYDQPILTTFDATSFDRDGSIEAIDTLYVDACGRLYPDCDMSYKDQDAYPFVKVSDLSRQTIQAFNHAIEHKI